MELFLDVHQLIIPAFILQTSGWSRGLKYKSSSMLGWDGSTTISTYTAKGLNAFKCAGWLLLGEGVEGENFIFIFTFK